MNECIICFDEIKDNHNFDLSCCNIKIHKICMYNWINSNLCKNKELNKNINKCFFCKQQSKELDNIIEIIKQNNNYTVIDIENNANNIENEIVTPNNERIKKFLIFVFFCTLTACTSITLIFLLIT